MFGGVRMDIEQLYSLVEKMYREMQEGFHGLNTRMDGIETRMDGLENRMDGIENRMDGIENRMDGLDGELKKVKIMIEHEIMPKVLILVEGHKSIHEQIEEKNEEVLADQQEMRDIFSLSINRLANEVSELKLSVDEIKEKMEKVEKVTMQNTYDVAYLKLAK